MSVIEPEDTPPAEPATPTAEPSTEEPAPAEAEQPAEQRD